MKLINWLQKSQNLQEEKILKSDEVFLDTIESLKETIRVQNEVINSLVSKPQMVENPINEQLKNQVEQLVNEKNLLENKIKELAKTSNESNLTELARVKESYKNLLSFCFENLDPMVSFDLNRAKSFWENLVK